MLTLTVWQPWASLIMIGAKPYEFRSWRPPFKLIGERMVIHAGARPVKKREVEDLITRLTDPDKAWSTALIKEKALPLLYGCLSSTTPKLPTLAGLGTVIVGAPKAGYQVCEEFGHEYVNDSDRADHSNWGWPMKEIRRFGDPIPAKGAQGLWVWPGRQDYYGELIT